jgi:hypothetical protein
MKMAGILKYILIRTKQGLARIGEGQIWLSARTQRLRPKPEAATACLSIRTLCLHPDRDRTCSFRSISLSPLCRHHCRGRHVCCRVLAGHLLVMPTWQVGRAQPASGESMSLGCWQRLGAFSRRRSEALPSMLTTPERAAHPLLLPVTLSSARARCAHAAAFHLPDL